jgi:hypothetical protein
MIPPNIQQILDKFEKVFKTPDSLPPSREYDHTITLLTGTTPVNLRPYRYSPLQKDEIERQVQDMLKSGIITRSVSPFASPVLLLKKKDGSWRFCVDYRKLNDITVKNKFPMPIIDEFLDELSGATYFSKLDMASGFHQIRMAEADELKTALKTHHGHFQFRVMPFGLTNAPATFQCLMNVVFQELMRKCVLIFMDDIPVYSPTLEAHAIHLNKVFQILQDHQLYAKRSKCSFAVQQIDYLGHVISHRGVATDPSKTVSITRWPVPTSHTELRGFLGLTGYYRKFVKGYGMMAKPLTSILQQKQFNWSSAAQTAFEELKSAMISTPVLALPNFNEEFVIETDASDRGIGAVLSQNGHPIAFYSKALGVNNSKLSTYEKEFLAILMAVDKWRCYLQRGSFVIRSDHKSLSHLQDQSLATDLQKKAMAKLAGLQFTVQYKKGSENKAADALSRVPAGVQLAAISIATPVWIQEVLKSYELDPQAQELLQELAIQSPNPQGYSLYNGLIYKQHQLVVGQNVGLHTKLISAFHASAVGGHSGILPTYQRLKKLFYWPGQKTDVELFVKQCQICQQAKHENCKYPGLLQPLPIPHQSWQDLSMDFVEGLPKSKGYTVILVVVDRLTKYAHFVPLKHPYTAAQVAQVFFSQIVKLHGIPRSIVSDRDRVFTSHFWQELFRLTGTTLQLSSAYHPQSDGQTERINQCLEMFLRCAVHQTPSQWVQWLDSAELWYNSSYHSSLKCSPFKALYGVDPNWGVLPVPMSSDPSDAQLTLQQRQDFLQLIKANLATTQNRMK